MSNQQFEKLVGNLQGVMRCPHCSGTYQMEDVHYLGQMDSMTFLHMRCAQCQTPVFASIALTNEEGEIKPADIATNEIQINSKEEMSQPDLNFSHKQLDSVASNKEVDIPVEDITVDRILKAALTPVSYDDVLDAHNYVDRFEGDFENTFGSL